MWGGGWRGRGSLVCLPPLHLFLPLSVMSDPRPCIRGGDLPRLREMSALSPSPLPPSPGFCEWNQNDTFRFHQSHHSHQFHAYWRCNVQLQSSDQIKMVSMPTKKTHMHHTPSLRISLTLTLKQFQCLSDCLFKSH